MSIGETIRDIRKKSKLNQTEFAEKLGITQTYLSLLEAGKKVPSLKVLGKIAFEFDIPVEVILFKGLNRAYVPAAKRDIFDQLKPVIDTLIDGLFIVRQHGN